jgi:GT2 family glycosyltransferase|tara:strand:- start:387 stop:1115 length:729 start_codon:yes stop_codon:yes gene_type:complete
MVTISLVSHGHADMIVSLTKSLLKIKEIEKIIVTLNIPEAINLPRSNKIKLINNITPIGFGHNHNNAFKYSESNYFCVLNPDISIINNPFPVLIEELKSNNASLVAPLIVSPLGLIEDSIRYFPSISLLLKKLFFSNKGSIVLSDLNNLYTPDWVAGMFMLFKAESYKKAKGFDEKFFLYYEDVDLCARFWTQNLKIVASSKATVIHDAQRASRNNFTHFGWHILSIIRYLLKHWGRLPKHE